MESPKETFEKYKRITNINAIAYDRLFINYLKLGLKGSKKLVDIESTNQEDLINQKLHGVPQIGMIYTFIHINKEGLNEIINAASGKVIKFHDFTPILFITSFNGSTGIIKGLNLNLLPNKERLKFLQVYWEFFNEFLKKVEEKTEYNELALNKEYQRLALSGKNSQIIKMFNNDQDASFEYAYRSYDLKNIRNFRMIEYNEWKYIPFYDSRESFKKTNLKLIYDTYYDNRTK
ncbi:hypothetical protein M0Q50_04900 [bacterium]|jgi:hypothetical protein|nr:hypothetical protein [bacterium]